MIEFLVAWLPFIVIMMVLFFFLRVSQRKYAGHIDEVNRINQEILETNREMIAELREIAKILKDQK